MSSSNQFQKEAVRQHSLRCRREPIVVILVIVIVIAVIIIVIIIIAFIAFLIVFITFALTIFGIFGMSLFALKLVDEDGEAFDDVGREIVRRFEAEEALKVAVLSIMGKDLVVEVSKDTEV